jgi:hypothetical protein
MRIGRGSLNAAGFAIAALLLERGRAVERPYKPGCNKSLTLSV